MSPTGRHLAIPAGARLGPTICGLPATGDEQRVIVRMPNGFEYMEMEVAQTGVLRGTGEIKYDWHHTHSSVAEVEHTPTGLAS
jgi:hypothetical protein